MPILAKRTSIRAGPLTPTSSAITLQDRPTRYKYYMGETIKHPLGYNIKIDTPLDFAGVTDHAEYAGVVRLSNDPTSPLSKMPFAKELVVHNAADIQRIYLVAGHEHHGDRAPD